MSSQLPIALKSYRWILIATPIILLIMVGGYLIWKSPPTQISSPFYAAPTPSKTGNLAPFGRSPDWSKLDRFQNTISKETFLNRLEAVSYTHLRAHETVLDLVCRLLLEKKKK